jgi:cyclopropane fatty-acyl-phospholipid synthase-like methyltransferase
MTERDLSGGLKETRPASGFDAAYRVGQAPWDLGRPQTAFRELADGGRLVGRVLDVGCGTGEHVLMASAMGLDATGVDTSPTAIAIAMRKASQRGLPARFLSWDALRLAELGESFDTVIDCGLFHVFDDRDRREFLGALVASMQPGARYFLVCFSDLEPGGWGPRRIRQEEIRACFSEGWLVEGIEPTRLEITVEPGSVHAWLATIRRA